MTHFQKLNTESILKWVGSVFAEKHFRLSKPWSRTRYISNTPPACARKALCTTNSPASDSEAGPGPGPQTTAKISPGRIAKAQAALLDYLHCTRGYQFIDAEHISKNSPNFLRKLLGKADDLQDIGRSLSRFFLYHPINEFEPFLESLGLDPSEVAPLLPRDLNFLTDCGILLENFSVLCNYGIPRNRIGQLYKEAIEIFEYESGVLRTKLKAYEELGLDRESVIGFVASSPSLLKGGINEDFVEALDDLKGLGLERNWVCGSLSEKDSYNWSKILILLHFFLETGCSQEELKELFVRNPEILLGDSGKKSFTVIAVSLKLGIKMGEIMSLFLKLPQIKSGSSITNLRSSLFFLIDSGMSVEEIGKIMHTHLQLLASCYLKRPSSVLLKLKIGKRRLCEMIVEDPNQIRKWVVGSKVTSLPVSGEDGRSLKERTIFLLNLGFVQNSDEMNKALKVFRGKGDKLQERFDCLVKAGLNQDDVYKMIRSAPQVLNQSRSVIEQKINFLVNDLGYPLESLLTFPAFIAYTMERVTLRCSMYNWLKDEGLARPMLALSTIFATSEKTFVRQFVNVHPNGAKVWARFKREICTT
ncbi:hypothetical protein ACLOJK_005583 [Asimina triloba]